VKEFPEFARQLLLGSRVVSIDQYTCITGLQFCELNGTGLPV
jgi:hypothetical protein